MTEDRAGEALGPTRRRVLQAVGEASGGLSAVDVARLLDVHPNSARFHLDALVEAGLVERGTEERTSPGRPKILYAASARLTPPGGGWQELAQILTEAVVSRGASPAGAAERAGERHGRALAAGIRPGDVPEQVAHGLRRLGFDSSAHRSRGGGRIEIRPCPFLDLVRTHGEVVCGVHRGLLSGMLTTLDPEVTLDRLDPFVRPGLCVARFRRP